MMAALEFDYEVIYYVKTLCCRTVKARNKNEAKQKLQDHEFQSPGVHAVTVCTVQYKEPSVE